MSFRTCFGIPANIYQQSKNRNNLFVLNIKDADRLSDSYLYYAMVDETVSKFIKKNHWVEAFLR